MNAFFTLLVVAAVLYLLYCLGVWLTPGRPSAEPRALEYVYTPPALPPPAPARACKDFGPHANPFENGEVCTAEFEQFDGRTWQCPVCKLLKFQREETVDAQAQ